MKYSNDLYINIVNKTKFIIGNCALFAYLYSFYDTSSFYYEIVLYSGAIYSSIDLFFTSSNESRIHHIFNILLCSYYHNVLPNDRPIIVYPVLNTEISSIFYILKEWLEKSKLYNINLGLFYLAFFKFRIYHFYILIYTTHVTMNMAFPNFIILACDGLFIMNLYWFAIMNKIVYKHLTKYIDINKDILCRFICSYIYFMNIPLVLSMYTLNKKNMYDILGVSILAISSHAYHSDICNSLIDKIEYQLPTKDNIVLFTNDILCIHIRCILAIVTNCYNSFNNCIYISGIIHFICLYAGFLNILYLMKNEINNLNHSYFYKYHNLIMFIPYIYDSYLFSSITPIEVTLPFLLINTIIIIIMAIEPFYKLNHVAFHLCIIIQTYYICLSNNLT